MYQQDNQVNSDLIHQISNSYEIKVKNAVPFQLSKFNTTLDSFIKTAKDRNKKNRAIDDFSIVPDLFVFTLFYVIYSLSFN